MVLEFIYIGLPACSAEELPQGEPCSLAGCFLKDSLCSSSSLVQAYLLCLQGASQLGADVEGCPSLRLVHPQRCILPDILREGAALAHNCWGWRKGLAPLCLLPAQSY